jgi:hypothetical protein
MDGEHLLWQRVVALRGLRTHVSGARFQVQVSRIPPGQTNNVERVSRLLCDSGCNGVVGEIVAKRNESPRRARILTRPGLGMPALD